MDKIHRIFLSHLWSILIHMIALKNLHKKDLVHELWPLEMLDLKFHQFPSQLGLPIISLTDDARNVGMYIIIN